MTPQKKRKMLYSRIALFSIMIASIVVYVVMEANYLNVTNRSPSPVSLNQFIEISEPLTFDVGSNLSVYSDATSGFYACTKDGLRFYSVTGMLSWQDVFSMCSTAWIFLKVCTITRWPISRPRAIF